MKFSDACHILAGGTPSTHKANYWGGNIPWISIKDLNTHKYIRQTEKTITNEGFDSCPSAMLQHGDIVVSARGSVGKTAVATGPMAFNQSCFALRSKTPNLNQEFLYYWLQANNKIFAGSKQGNVFKSITQDFFDFCEINYPALPIQRHIASILGSLDEKIEINRRKIEKLEALSRMIYEHWFVQFDFPDANGKPYKSSGGKMVWNEELKQEVPDGWQVISFSDIVDIEKDSVAPEDFMHLTVEHYSIPAFDEKHWPAFEHGTEIASNKFRVSNQEFLVSKLNPQFKRIWNPICKTPNALCSTEFMVFNPKNHKMKPYCYSVADGIAFYNFMVAHASSSTGSRKRFPSENIQFFKFAHPEKNVILEQFNSIQKENLIQISLRYANIEKLIALRDWLLPMLMNGQVTVGE